MPRFAASLLALVFPPTAFLHAAPLGLVLPTDNAAIFSEDPSQFYMYTDRNFEGVLSKPWSGGAYGFTRDQKRTGAGIILTRLHEGIDIRPVKRDASGEPLDEVRSIADGTVVYVNGAAGQSNYGRYVVVHHDWGDGPFFSLYAHLSSASVTAGQPVAVGADQANYLFNVMRLQPGAAVGGGGLQPGLQIFGQAVIIVGKAGFV